MFEASYKSFVNDYGYDEAYISKSIESHLSGHLYRGSAIETDCSCGNCDGGRCESCIEIFEVAHCGVPIIKENEYGWDEQFENVLERRRFVDEEKALDYYNNL